MATGVSVTPKNILQSAGQLGSRTCFHDQELTGGLIYSAFDSTLGFDTNYGHTEGLIAKGTRLDNICTQIGDSNFCLEKIRAETYGSEWFGINEEKTSLITRFRVTQGDQTSVYELTQSRRQAFLFDSGNLFALENQNIWDDVSFADKVEVLEGDDLGVTEQALIQARNAVSNTLQQKAAEITDCISTD